MADRLGPGAADSSPGEGRRGDARHSPRAVPHPYDRRSQQSGVLALLAISALWGFSFLVVKGTLSRVPPFDLLTVRFGIAAVALAALAPRVFRAGRRTWLQGLWLGSLFGAGQVLQTLGLQAAAVATIGFLTGLYVVFTPLIAAGLRLSRIGPANWVAVTLTCVGLAAFTWTPGTLTVDPGELYGVACALFFAAHIVSIDRMTSPEGVVPLSAITCAVASLVTLPPALADGLQLPATAIDWAAVLFLALGCGVVVMVAQMWAQVRVGPTTVAVVMCSEPLFAALFGVVLGGEPVTVRMLSGGSAILLAMLVSTRGSERS